MGAWDGGEARIRTSSVPAGAQEGTQTADPTFSPALGFVRVLGFEPDVLQIRHNGHAKMGLPDPLPAVGRAGEGKIWRP